MQATNIDRRAFLAGTVALAAISTGSTRSLASTVKARMQVFASPSCGCCKGWIDHVRSHGFAVETTFLDGATLNAKKADLGITPNASSCHTGLIDGYVVEGHVPAAEIERLFKQRPEALGLTVPGMPTDAPGMGTGSTPFDVMLLKAEGSMERFARYPKA